jgi:hypothetical protein
VLIGKALLTASAGVLLLVGASTNAAALGHPPSPPPPTTGGAGHTVTVTVVGSGVKGGSAGKPARAGVVVRSPCWMNAGFTGKKYYEWVTSGAASRDWYHQGGSEEGPFKPKPGYEKYKDDDKGHWYGGSCSSEGFENLKEFFAYSDKWFAEHDSVYVPAGVEPPVPPIPPEVLREAASKAMTLPGPKIDWNPKRNGDAATLVNLATWVWLTDQNTDLYVTASAGGNSVTVNASLASMTVSGPNGESTDCVDGGVPYTSGASGGCTIAFTRSSSAGGTSPVSTTTQWNATWSINGGPSEGPIPDPLKPATEITNIAIREVEAIGTR